VVTLLMTASDFIQRPNGWMVQRDDVSPAQYLDEDGAWVATAGAPTWFPDADAAATAPRPAGTVGTVIQMWFADDSVAGDQGWRIERRRWPRVTMTYIR
jgi:hypothetical protein